MNTRTNCATITWLIIALASSVALASPEGAGFTYQGQLVLSGTPVTGSCDFQFTLWDAPGSGTPPAGGAQIGGAVAVNALAVDRGLFTVLLNGANEFGTTAFNGEARWLQIAVRSPAGSGAFTTLAPRQVLTTAPSAATLVPGATVNATNQQRAFQVINSTFGGSPVGIYGQSQYPTTAWDGSLASLAGIGVRGDSNNGVGVVGTSGFSAGVYGASVSNDGVSGTSSNGNGVRGTAVNAAASGVYGENTGAGGYGVAGRATGFGTAVLGDKIGAGGYAGRFNGNVSVSGDVAITGRITSNVFQATRVLNAAGPLPNNGNYISRGGTMLVFVSGSGFSAAGSATIGMNLLLDGTVVDGVAIYANAAATHMAFVPKQLVVSGVAAGFHTFRLEPYAGTSTDAMDSYFISVTELPF